MRQYNVTGMSCAACSARVEKAVLAVEGVTECSVNLLTNSMAVSGDVSSENIIKAVENAGYGASVKGGDSKADNPQADALKDKETPAMLKRLLASIGFLLLLMYFSMGHSMLGLPLPEFFESNCVAQGLAQLLLTCAVMVINQKFFINGFKGVMHRSPNMDTLVALGASAAFVYSTYSLFLMSDAQAAGYSDTAMKMMHELYFESAGMILTLITLGKMLEAYSKGKTTNALKSLMELAPKTAVIERDGKEIKVPVGEVKKGDIFVVRAGESIAVDGTVIDGNGAVDESALTGESIPVDKKAGDSVCAATVNKSGFLRCEAKRVGEDTTIAQIIKTVSDAAATKAPIAKVADKVSGVFVPVVISIAAVTLAAWLIIGKDIGFALARSISVLVISCPCALGLATPVAIMVGSGVGAKNGILFKNAVSLENAGKCRIAVLDKTGTVTKGEPAVTDIIPCGDAGKAELLTYAYSLEKMSEHPLARAVVKYATENDVSTMELSDYETAAGSGVLAVCGGEKLVGGNLEFVSGFAEVDDSAKNTVRSLAAEGKTPLLFCLGNVLLGIIAVADIIKQDSQSAVAELKNMGLKVILLTGDNKYTAETVGKQAGVDEVIAGVLPDEKAAVVSRLKTDGGVVMVGDGINDAPALTCADVGIAIGAGTDIAIDAADVVLMNSSLGDVPAALRLSRKTLKNIYENLFWAFIYNIIGIPLAAGVYIHFFGWELNPMFAATAMSLSSFCVVTNALRLNLLDVHNTRNDRNVKKSKGNSETFTVKKMTIEGMMCGHCEATVKSVLESIDGVVEAQVSHETGVALVTISKEVPDEVLKRAVEAEDYQVKNISVLK